MANSVNFKYGATLENKTVAENDFVAVNKGMDNVGNAKFGSIYKGDKILGTTEADNLVLTSDITIAGGPLEADGKTAWADGVIPAGTSMQDIMMKLFCVEKWPTSVTTSSATLVSKMNTPTLTFNGKSSNNTSSTVEVGTTVNYEAKSGASSSTATAHKASGFTYGYSAADDNTKDSSDTSKSASFGTISAVADSVPTLVLSGAISETINGTAGSAAAGAATKSGTFVVASATTYSLTAKGTSITYTGTCSELPVLYGCSNLNNTHKEDGTTYPSTKKDQVTLTSTAVNSSTITVKCAGDYYAFVGYADTMPTTSDEFRGFIGNGLTHLSKGGSLSGTCTKTWFGICIPSDWDFSITDSMGNDIKGSFKNTGSVNIVLPNGDEKAYTYYCMPYNNGAYKSLVIK